MFIDNATPQLMKLFKKATHSMDYSVKLEYFPY
jgi:hypothetical protein